MILGGYDKGTAVGMCVGGNCPTGVPARVAFLAVMSAAAAIAALTACGPDVETCEDQLELELRFDERVVRDDALVLTVGEETARVDCSLATHPIEDGAMVTWVASRADGRARAYTWGSIH